MRLLKPHSYLPPQMDGIVKAAISEALADALTVPDRYVNHAALSLCCSSATTISFAGILELISVANESLLKMARPANIAS